MKFLENINHERKVFWTFLLIHLAVWTCIALVRTVMPTDALEGVYWGGLHDFGTPKHPPFAGWVTYWVYSIFKTDFSVYLISQLFIFLGFVYIYKLGKIFFNESRAMLSVIILEGCWVYSYITGYYGFNPDVILLGMLPLITYYFYKVVTENKNIDWILFGIFVGICFLNKYQTALVLIPMFIWVIAFKRDVFKNKMFYLSALIAFVIFSPHILWMIEYDFFPLLYFEGEFKNNTLIRHIVAPLVFLIMQIAAIAGTLVIYAALKLKQKSKFNLNFDVKDQKTWLLILLGFTPLFIHLCMGIFEGGTMRPRWGFEFLYLTGIMLFYFFPTKEIERKDFDFAVKLSYVAMLIIFIALGTLLSVEKNYRSRYPVSVIYNDMNNIWAQNFNTPLKYFGGYIEWTLPLTIYNDSHPQIILDTNGYKNPWIDEDDLKASGIIVIDRTIPKLEKQLKISCPYLDENYEINPIEYKFTVTNAFNMPREYTIYYLIVPPMK